MAPIVRRPCCALSVTWNDGDIPNSETTVHVKFVLSLYIQVDDIELKMAIEVASSLVDNG